MFMYVSRQRKILKEEKGIIVSQEVDIFQKGTSNDLKECQDYHYCHGTE